MVLTPENGRPKGHNTTDLYLHIDGSRIEIDGIHRGIRFSRELTIEQEFRDTLVVKDRNNSNRIYKFRSYQDTISGKHNVVHDDGTCRIYSFKAVIRKLTRRDINKMKMIFRADSRQ
ncbi:MAG: hypothetical protein ACLFQB_05330 [Chitinispirillaceae bacterium]